VPQPVGWRAARAADHLLPLPEDAWQLNVAWEYVATALEGEQLIREGAGPDLLDAWSEQSVESGRPMGWTTTNTSAVLAVILRDLLGPLPFRPVTISPDVLAWGDRLVVRLARAIYDERRWGDMPLLRDALLDAGCDSDDILSHCRQRGAVHVRGCFALDLLLGRG